MNKLDEKKRASFAVAAALSGALAGCASAGGTSAADDANDPLEVPNRIVFSINDALDNLLLRPIAYVYREALPSPIQSSIRSFMNYLRTPVILANDLLQGEWKRASTTVERFARNTFTLGLWDIAAEDGIPFHEEDFGQTLGVWGMGEMFYLVLPIFGPSNPRDGVGIVADHFLDPLGLYLKNTNRSGINLARAALDGVDTRSRFLKPLDGIEKTSLDYYATLRSLYRQKRADEIANGRDTGVKLVPGLSQDDDGLPTTQTSVKTQ
ncbi:MAG: VacJ family lipoprotein [Alphaproteobacteria bacterium]|nr:VacJ family lipoprotein [Alphaproteobacteria bacterium]